jgi:uncharacterized protein
MEVGFPFRITPQGRVASPPYAEHVRELIEQLLFTVPGERVNRPDLGVGLMELVFAPLDSTVLAVAEHQVRNALNRWLAELIEVEAVRVVADDSSLEVTVVYRLRRDRSRHVDVFRREVAA